MTIDPSATLFEALEAIQRGAVGLCIVADPDGTYRGLLTDGDLRRGILRSRKLDGTVSGLVADSSVTLPTHVDRNAALELMQARTLDAVPILEDRRVVGLHTLHDLISNSRRDNWAVIMAGGKGTRLGPLTRSRPKPMIDVAGRPILERVLLHLVGCGFTNVAISTNYLAEQIEDHIGDGAQYGASVIYLREDPKLPLGTAGSLTRLREEGVDTALPVLVTNADVLTQAPLGEMLDHHQARGACLTVGATAHRYQIPFGVLESCGEALVGICEKPEVSWRVAAGISVVEADLLTAIPDGQPFDMPDLYQLALADVRGAGIFDLDSRWLDVGRPEDLARARGEQP